MAKPKNDFASIGDLYGGMLNGIKQKLVSEGKLGPSVKPGEIGEVPLLKGGPQTTAGYMPAKVDKKTMSKKDIDDNLYDINSLSYDEDEETKKVKKIVKKAKTVKDKKKTEKDEEELVKESGKIAKERLNNFMRRKSIFDKLYENVMQPGGAPEAPMGGEMDDTQELDALGIEGEDEFGGEGEDEVTFTLDRATAEKLHEVLMSVLGAESDEDAGEGEYGEDEFGDEAGEDMGEDEEGFWDEDEEDLGHAIAGAKEVNMGKNNKVGNLKVQSGGASSAYTSKVGPDGDHGHALVNAKQPNMGKSNKVSSLKTGKSLFEQ